MIGDLFAGIGGAALAVHAVIPDAETVWQSDLVNEAVRARHFPGAAQLVGDVRALDPARLPRVDLLTAGVPCQDLSVAGAQAGLDGPRSRLYREVLRFCGARPAELYADDPTDDKPPGAWSVVYGGDYQPPQVLIENVPALLKLIPRLAADFRSLGYGLTWTTCEAADAGHPHLRRRVFVFAELDRRGRGLVEVDRTGRWQPEDLRVWPTPRADEARTSGGRAGREGVGESLTYAARPWASPRASDASRGSDPPRAHGGTGGIIDQVRTLPTSGKRLSPSWVEALMGYPPGWTLPTGPRLECRREAPAVRGRYPAPWGRSVPWPGYAWEPPRTIPDGPALPGRPARVRACGNAVCPQQGALALEALLADDGRQVRLW